MSVWIVAMVYGPTTRLKKCVETLGSRFFEPRYQDFPSSPKSLYPGYAFISSGGHWNNFIDLDGFVGPVVDHDGSPYLSVGLDAHVEQLILSADPDSGLVARPAERPRYTCGDPVEVVTGRLMGQRGVVEHVVVGCRYYVRFHFGMKMIFSEDDLDIDVDALLRDRKRVSDKKRRLRSRYQSIRRQNHCGEFERGVRNTRSAC